MWNGFLTGGEMQLWIKKIIKKLPKIIYRYYCLPITPEMQQISLSHACAVKINSLDY